MHRQGLVDTYGIVTLPNPAKISTYEARGFRQAAVFRHASVKNSVWLDVG